MREMTGGTIPNLRMCTGVLLLRAIIVTLAVAAVLAGVGAAPARAAPPFKHIIVGVQENRTPDNLFGSNPNFEPGVDISNSGLLSDGRTVPLAPLPLASCYDISHSHASFEKALTKGFDHENYGKGSSGCAHPLHPQYAYVDNSDGTVTPYFDIALANGFANRMFQTNQGPSFPAHQFLFGGTSTPTVSSPLFASENPKGESGCAATAKSTVALIDQHGSETAIKPIYPCFEHPVLPDLLDAAVPPISWRYYAQGPTGLWAAPNAIDHICQARNVAGQKSCMGADWLNNVVADNSSQILSDIQGCHLPAVTWVTPTAAESDHPSVNKGTGPSWVAAIVNAVGQSRCQGVSYWNDTAILITWDDWGGWNDHVPPFKVIRQLESGAGYTYGFRVPLLAVSAFTQAGQVSNDIFDFGSILAFIEHNFGLGTIGSGATRFDQYADYNASQSGRGDLRVFFTLRAPKIFLPIPSALTADYFINEPKTLVPPDDD